MIVSYLSYLENSTLKTLKITYSLTPSNPITANYLDDVNLDEGYEYYMCFDSLDSCYYIYGIKKSSNMKLLYVFTMPDDIRVYRYNIRNTRCRSMCVSVASNGDRSLNILMENDMILVFKINELREPYHYHFIISFIGSQPVFISTMRDGKVGVITSSSSYYSLDNEKNYVDKYPSKNGAAIEYLSGLDINVVAQSFYSLFFTYPEYITFSENNQTEIKKCVVLYTDKTSTNIISEVYLDAQKPNLIIGSVKKYSHVVSDISEIYLFIYIDATGAMVLQKLHYSEQNNKYWLSSLKLSNRNYKSIQDQIIFPSKYGMSR